MSVRLTPPEKQTARKLAEIKHMSGSHSPSPAMLTKAGVTIRHDFCYLSNPHATELFLKYFRKDFKDREKVRSLVEHYPSQNLALAEKLFTSPLLQGALPPSARGLFVGNGATEIIQAVLQHFTKRKILVPVPTFSPYLEFAPKGVRVSHLQLRKEANFALDLDELVQQVKKERPDTVVIINPNNPEGGYHFAKNVHNVLKRLKEVETLIVDESFAHFAGAKIESAAPWVNTHQNLVVIKSMSKDFGIAGVRLGYAVMSEKRVDALLQKGYLWNVSGFGEYFLDLLNRKDFLQEYEKARLRAIGERDAFYAMLSKVKGLHVYGSKGNFFLVELLDGTKADDLMTALLVRHGIYIRPCGDKVGLNGEFVRIASRKGSENRKLVRVLKKELLS